MTTESVDLVQRKLATRRSKLLARAGAIQESIDRGEGSSAFVELEYIRDELESMLGLERALLLHAIKTKLVTC